MNVMAFTMALWTTDVYGHNEAPSELAIPLYGLFRYLVLLSRCRSSRCWGCLCLSTPGAACVAASFRPTGCWPRGRGSVRGLIPLGLPRRGPDLLRGGLRHPGDDGTGPLAGSNGQAQGRRGAGRACQALAGPSAADRGRGRRVDPAGTKSRSTICCGCCPASDSRPTAGSYEPESLVDEQVLTGESRPVFKEPGDRILGGTLNLDGDLTIQVTEARSRARSPAWSSWFGMRANRRGATSGWPTGSRADLFRASTAVAIVTFGVHWAFGSLERGCWAAWRSA